VQSLAPVLFFTASLDLPAGPATIHLAGFDPATGRGGPPVIVQGRNLKSDGEIVLDDSFAAKFGIRLGDKVPIRDEVLVVCGFSGGTNMFVLQYAFITLQKAEDLLGFSGIVSCFQLKLQPGADPTATARAIRSQSADFAVFDRATFLQNNVREAETGVLPLLYVISLIGAVVLTAILSLILSVYVLEQQQDYAIMKALGASNRFVSGIVVKQALILASSGLVVALLLFPLLLRLVARFSPTVSAESSVRQVLMVAVGLLVISLISSIGPWLRQRRIYPLEAFR
jgi:putative ABC transport system permease protein